MSTRLTAHITGTVWKIVKRPGDSVAAGEPVLILESMKMEMPVEAPVAGKLGQLHCTEGQAVEEGALLATLE
jgi:acetyl-CoA carboxylase biotin carboxyl carrier protein